MSLILPIEDLSRLNISAILSETGQPILSLTLKPSSDNMVSNPNRSGIYIKFEGTVTDGCWTLAMETIFQEPAHSLQSENSSSLVPDVPVTNVAAPGQISDWMPGMMQTPLSAEPTSMPMPIPAIDNHLGWLPVSSTHIGQGPPPTISEPSVPPQFPPEVFDGFFPPSLPSTTRTAQPGSTATVSIRSSSPRYDEEDESDSTHSSHRVYERTYPSNAHEKSSPKTSTILTLYHGM
ncbi:hypothetical protein Moror_9333 [Moniliophthora roreri MCA 2997]|uniref:Uncharacterized protein n=1 Tax=Moniliophthora roreri (strain MCA 2997) TaxID=1381753 RepID=V2X0Z8_MONRO|nr:hypothetical protein Moror_9333 [Moniliophthora roreri MCA 2997]